MVLEALVSTPTTPDEYSAISRIGWIHYLAGKDDDLVGDSGSRVLLGLLNDVNTEGTSPDDRKFVQNLCILTLFE